MSYLETLKDSAKKVDWSKVLESKVILDSAFPAFALLAVKFPSELGELRAVLHYHKGDIAAGLRVNSDGNEDVVVYLDNIQDDSTPMPLLGIYTPPAKTGDMGWIRTASKEPGRKRWHASPFSDDTCSAAAIAAALSGDYYENEYASFTRGSTEEDLVNELSDLSADMIRRVRDLAFHVDYDSNVAKRGGYKPTKMLTDHSVSIFKLDANKKYAEKEAVTINFDAARDQDLFTRKYEEFSETERMMIPQNDPSYVYTKEDKIISEEIIRTAHKKVGSQVLRNLLVSGDPGCGKSALARSQASIFQRPLCLQTLSANTSEDELLGILMPCVDGASEAALPFDEVERKIYSTLKEAAGSDSFSIIDAVADVLGYPTLASCYLSPQAAAEELGGEASDASEAAALLDTVVGAKIAVVVSKAKAATGGNEGVRYQYIESPIVTAVRNGYFLEIQEPTNVAQQSVFSCLYDVLERSSVGILQTPLGPVKRHPDFVCIATTNHNCTGNKPLSEAFSSRFQMKIDMDPPSEEELVNRILAKTDKGLAETGKAMDIVQVYQQTINACKEIGTRLKPTPRELFMFADAIFDGVDPKLAYSLYIISACSHENDERAEIIDAVEDLPLMRKAS